MTTQQIATVLNATDTLLAAIDATARYAAKAIRYTAKAAKVTWRYAKPVMILMLAIAIVLGFKTYEAGAAFRIWCDRLVAVSLASPHSRAIAPTQIAGYLMPSLDTLDTPDVDMPTVPNPQENWMEQAIAAAAKVAPALTTDAETAPYTLEAIAQDVDIYMAMPIRELKKLASQASIPNYSKMTKRQLAQALAGGNYTDLIASTYNKQWATKRFPIATLKPNALHYPSLDEVFAD